MIFEYTATNKDGDKVNGTIDAATKDAAARSINNQGLRPIIIKAETASNHKAKSKSRLGKVKLKDLVVFTRQLSTMVSAGVPLTRSLSTLQGQSSNKYFRQVIADITKDIESGMPLADAFAKFPDVFSDVYINMVRAGEAGGILDDILKRLAAQIEKDASIRKKIKSAMAYPVVILVITIVAFFGIMFFVIPKISKILLDLGGPDAKLPIYTRVLLSISDFMQHNAILMIVVFAITTYLIRRYIKTPRGKRQLHSLLLKIPVLNTIIVKVSVARFARTFASLMSAGVGVLDALDVTGAALGNVVIQDELKEAAKAVKNGKQLSEPLAHSAHFPPIVSQMLAVGEETGKIDTVLVKVANFYEEEVDAVIDALSSIIEPIMIIILGSIVGIIAASVMGPIASLSQNIGNE